MKQKVKDHPDLVRDTRTGAIINTNPDIFHAVMARRRRAQNDRKEINELKDELAELKQLLINKNNEQ